MMQQSIDFLKVIPKPINRVPAWLMAVIIGAFVCMLIISSVISYMNYHKVQLSLIKQEEQLKIAQIDYNKLIKKYPLLANNVPLLTLVSTVEQEYNEKREKFESLKYLLIRPGFSQYLSSLAQTTPSTIWLNRIQINHSLSLVTINGYVLRPDSVAELMSNLSTTKAFSNVLFNSFAVKAIKNHSYEQFTISTHDIIPEEGATETSTDVGKSNQTTIKTQE